jgi:hypothetical protein
VDQDEFAELIADGRRIEDDLKAATAGLRALAASNYRNSARITRQYLDDGALAKHYDQEAERLSPDDSDGW